MLVKVDVTAAREFSKSIDPENNQHEAHAKLKGEGHSFTDLHMQQDDGDAGDEQRDGMADTPQSADQRRTEKTFTLADNGGDGCQVVGLDGVLETQHKAEGEN